MGLKNESQTLVNELNQSLAGLRQAASRYVSLSEFVERRAELLGIDDQSQTQGLVEQSEYSESLQNNPLLDSRGLKTLRPEILTVTELLRVFDETSEEQLSINLSPNSVSKVTSVAKLFELTKSIELSVKSTTEAILKDLVYPTTDAMLNVISVGSFSLNMIQSYKTLFPDKEFVNNNDVLLDILKKINVSDLFIFLESLPEKEQLIEYAKAFAITDYDEYIERSKSILLSSTSSLISSSENQNLQQIKFNIIYLLLRVDSNLNFRNSRVVTAIFETIAIRKLLTSYAEFINSIRQLQINFKESIDFKTLNNFFQFKLNSINNILSNYSAIGRANVVTTINKIDQINENSNNVSITQNINEESSYSEISPQDYLDIIGVSESYQLTNLQAFFGIFSKLGSEFLFMSDIYENNIIENLPTDTLPHETESNLFSLIKKIKLVSYHDYYSYLISPWQYAQYNSSISTMQNFASQDDVAASFNSGGDSPYVRRNEQLIREADIEANRYRIKDVANHFFNADISSKEERLQLSIDLLCSSIFDYIAGYNINRLIDTNTLPDIGDLSDNRYNYFKEYFKNICNISECCDINSELIKNQSTGGVSENFSNRYQDYVSDNSSNPFGALTDVIFKSLEGENIALIETQFVQGFVEGYKFYITSALENQSFDFLELKAAVNSFAKKVIEIINSIIKIFSLDYDENEINPHNFMKQLLSSMVVNINNSIPGNAGIAGAEDDIIDERLSSRFQSAFAQFIQINSADNPESLEEFIKTVYNNKWALDDYFGRGFGGGPDGSDYVLAPGGPSYPGIQLIPQGLATKVFGIDFFSKLDLLDLCKDPTDPLETTTHIIEAGDHNGALTKFVNLESYGKNFAGSNPVSAASTELTGYNEEEFIGGNGEGWSTNNRWKLFINAHVDRSTDIFGGINLSGDGGIAEGDIQLNSYYSQFSSNPNNRLTKNLPSEKIIRKFFDIFPSDYNSFLDSSGGKLLNSRFNNFFHKKSGGPIGYYEPELSTILIAFSAIFYNYIDSCKLSMSITRSGFFGSSSDDVYKIAFNETLREIINKTLEGESKDEILSSGNIVAERFPEAIDRVFYAYDKCIDTINKKSQRICNKLKLLISVVDDVVAINNSLIDKFDTSLNSSAGSVSSRIINNLYSNYFPNQINGSLVNNSIFFNQDYLSSYLKEIAIKLNGNEKFSLFSSTNTITDTQTKVLFKLLNRKSYNFQKNVARGKQSIFTIGLTNGMIETLRRKSHEKTQDADYLKAKYVVIEIFKHNTNVDLYQYAPKYFIFDITKHVIENVKGLPNNHLDNYSDSWDINDLRNNFTIFDLSNESESNAFQSKSGRQIIDTLPDDTKEAGRQLIDNHIYDNYLKIYLYLTQGIVVNNSSFIIDQSVHQKLKEADLDKQDLLEIFKNEILLKYPSANVDPTLLFEFNRMNKQISDSLILKPKNKAISILSPKCFDRVYSLLINEEDFELKYLDPHEGQGTDALLGVNYTAPNKTAVSARLSIALSTRVERSAFFQNESTDPGGNVFNRHSTAINNNTSTASLDQYFCTVSILKELPKDLNTE